MKITRCWNDWIKGTRIDEGHEQGRWEVLDVLQGGMGRVYIVFDHQLQRRLAMKGFQWEMWDSRTADVQAKFEKEALTWVKLDPHPNVVQALFVSNVGVIHRFGPAHPRAGKTLGGLYLPFLFLEFIEGGDLGKWIGTPALIHDLARVLQLAIQFCDGMQHILAKGIVAHRDIKPGNCLVTKEGVLKVTDFGLAKAFDDSVFRPNVNSDGKESGSSEERVVAREQNLHASLSRTGTAAGTTPYMAPEQFIDAKHVDVTADVYSFGVMLFQMVCGRLPFVGSRPEEYFKLHATKPPPPLQTHANVSADVVKKLNGIVAGCLAKRAKDRIGNFGILRERLCDLYLELTGREGALPELTSPPDPMALADRAANLVQLRIPMAEVMPLFDKALGMTVSNDYVWLKKGHALVRYNEREKALECFNTTLNLNPANVNAWVNKGCMLAYVNRQQEALECYEQALKLSPRHRAALVGKGWRLAALGRRNDALAHFEYALRLNPTNSEFALGVQLIACHDRASGNGFDVINRLSYEANLQPGKTFYPNPSENANPGLAVTINPSIDDDGLLPEKVEGTIEEFFNRGVEAAQSGRWEEAGAWFERTLELNQQRWDVWGLHGTALKASARPEGALTSFETGLRINDRSEQLWSSKGEALHALGRCEEALAASERAVSLNPRYALGWARKGTILVELGRDGEALLCFDMALSIHPGIEDAWTNKIVLFTKLGRNDEALAACDAHIPINPRNGWFNKGVFLLQTLKRPAEALPCFEQAKKLGHGQADQGIRSCQPQRPPEKMVTVKASWTSADVRKHVLRSEDGSPSTVEDLMSRGSTAMQGQRFDEAVQLFNRALALNPQSGEAWYRHGIASLVLQRHAEGLTSLEKAQQQNHAEAARQLLYWKQKMGMYKA